MTRSFPSLLLGMIVHPKATLDELAGEKSIRPAVTLTCFSLALTLLNLAFFAALGFDWLGTRRELSDPTYVGFFGRLRVDTENYVAIYNFVVNPLLALTGLVFVPGVVHLLGKLWNGEGTFEQMVNTIGFAVGVPSLVISSLLNDFLLGGILPNLLTGHPYAFTAAQQGEFGSTMQTLWWIYMIGIYIIAKDVWSIALGVMAAHRIQKIPVWASVTGMTFAYALWYYGIAGTFVR